MFKLVDKRPKTGSTVNIKLPSDGRKRYLTYRKSGIRRLNQDRAIQALSRYAERLREID